VNRFIGIAMMKSAVDFSKAFPLWTDDSYYKGLCQIEWIFIKDAPYNEFKGYMVPGTNKEVIRARDSTRIDSGEGRKIYKTFQDYVNSNTILEHFEYYDIRQESYVKQNMTQQ
jgi:hypothetical protein